MDYEKRVAAEPHPDAVAPVTTALMKPLGALQAKTLIAEITPTLEINSDETAVMTFVEIGKSANGVRSLRRRLGNRSVVAMVTKIVNELCGFVSSELDSAQKVSYAKMLVNNYKHAKLEDFLVCFRNAINGKYGVARYHKLDYITITSWLRQHEFDREEYLSDQHETRKQGDVEWGAERTSVATSLKGQFEKVKNNMPK
ncbi:MAG: hypothetical protein COA65_09765 [Rhodospirillaceae bacterium]|nr:MAG: hypothetical protein COA65_09765 [Rhodospirillaceae bacterium]